MRTLAHLSDLHFGSVDHALLEPLRRRVIELEPHLVVVSGDLTQRARAREFREARLFLDMLPKPQIVVPGNHDVPLYNVFKRFFGPLANFCRYITDDPEPSYIDEEIAVVGINTARSLTFKGGRISEEQVQHIRNRICDLDERVAKIIVTHHPFDLPEHMKDHQIVGRARMAMATLAQCGADILLAGHMHLSHTGHTADRYRIGDYSALVVQAGTATSTRERGEENSFNAVRIITPHDVGIERYTWDPRAGEFTLSRREAFERTREGWIEKAGT